MKRKREATWSDLVQTLRSGEKSVRELLPELERLLPVSYGGREPDDRESEDGDDDQDSFSSRRILERGSTTRSGSTFRLHYLEVPFSIWEDLFDEEWPSDAARTLDTELHLPEADLFPAFTDDRGNEESGQVQMDADVEFVSTILRNTGNHPTCTGRIHFTNTSKDWMRLLHDVVMEGGKELEVSDYIRLLSCLSNSDLADVVLVRIFPGLLLRERSNRDGDLSKEMDQLLEVAFHRSSFSSMSLSVLQKTIAAMSLEQCGLLGVFSQAKLLRLYLNGTMEGHRQPGG
ncbi:hypothetical protein NDN08_005694 [Rhodosorus marinus]|uniref:Uncharacterized protein n=1 Tax=Rhodosorus marinus TaxID=101924 RepID=A0AAV8V341_9RHOD|nr:hypothetical protein NDN08_005694 [Rhodosorus marinus]